MKRSTHLMIYCCYYYAQLLGILNFSFDGRTRKAYTNKYVTIYAGLMNAALFGLIPYLAMTMELKTRPPGSAELIYKLNVYMLFIRIAGVLAALISIWSNRNKFIELINSYQLFCQRYLEKYQKRDKFMKYMERAIRIKCRSSLATDVILFVGSINVFPEIFEIYNKFILMALALMPIFLNVIMTQYYFALQHANVLLLVINEELEWILKVSQCAAPSNSKRFLIEITSLSDYVNVLAGMVIQLLNYVTRVNRIYDIQVICCMMIVYVNNICVIYIGLMTSAPEKLWNAGDIFKIIIAVLAIVMHYFDLKLFMYSILDASSLVNKLGKLLKFKQCLLSCADLELKRSLMNFSLQVAAFPLEIDLLGLYIVNKPTVFAVFGSTIANAIVLLQYDFKFK
ncbi:putative gustatory receptor 59d [Calliphora vicina]|uniref:putative gustatory receptor 59d n=1 Tax=Calliphora vicina TaxID=7373 RepID=UPI00325C0D3E